MVRRDLAYIFDTHRPEVALFAGEVDKVLVGMQRDFNDEFHPQHFELVLLEEVLKEVCDTWSRRVKLYKSVVEGFLFSVSDSMHAEHNMHRLVPLKDSLQSFEGDINGAIKCLEDLLDNDDDMVDLLLTEKFTASKQGNSVDPRLHEVVELLIEDYNRQLQLILQEITLLERRVQTAQEIITLSLDAFRNRMVLMNVQIGVG